MKATPPQAVRKMARSDGCTTMGVLHLLMVPVLYEVV
jgi:hypothetical protein